MAEADETGAEIDVNAFARVIRDRRSINLFEPEPVGEAVLLDGIELARWAPNHRLTEPWRFYLIGETTKEAVDKCAADFETEAKGERIGAARLQRLRGIPAYFVVTSRRSADDALQDREDFAATCCAVQNLMLYLWCRGVGVKWTTGAITREPRFYDLLGIDADAETIVGFFWYGRPKVIPEQARAGLDQFVVKMD